MTARAKKSILLKDCFWAVLCTTFFFSIISSLRYVICIDEKLLDHPPALIILSLFEKALLICHTTVFLLISIAISFLILGLFHKIVAKFLEIKIGYQNFIFLFWFLFIVYLIKEIFPKVRLLISDIVSTKWIHTFLSVIPIFLLAIFAIVFIFKWIKKAKDIKQLVVSSASAFSTIIFFIYMYIILKSTLLSSLVEIHILRISIALILSASLSVVFYFILIQIFAQLYNAYNKKTYLKFFIVTYSILALSISMLGYFWEKQETRLGYKNIFSDTDEDINIIIILLDALRAGHLGSYGYSRRTSPHIDAFAKEAILFENCYSQASWTKPSISTLFTSIYPSVHQVFSHGSALPERVTTIAEILKREGFITYAYISNPNLKAVFQFDQGFDFFDDLLMKAKLYYVPLRNIFPLNFIIKTITGKNFDWSDRDNAKLANERIIPWIERYKNENFFLYLHYMDPHDPYAPPAPYNNLFPPQRRNPESKNISLYDGEIRFADEHIAKLIEKLKSLNLYDKTLIIITADHGEAFGDHGDHKHGHTIYQEQVHVPLIIKPVGYRTKGAVLKEPVGLIDIMPTVLDTVSVDYPHHMEGVSLLPLLQKQSKIEPRHALLDENMDNDYILKGVVTKDQRWKYILTEKSFLRDIKKTGNEELYDLTQDPLELNNLAGKNPDRLSVLRSLVILYKNYCEKKALPATKKKIDRETLEQLKSLGYLH